MTRILVVEDDHILQELLVQILEVEGYECLTAMNGREGLERRQNHRMSS